MDKALEAACLNLYGEITPENMEAIRPAIAAYEAALKDNPGASSRANEGQAEGQGEPGGRTAGATPVTGAITDDELAKRLEQWAWSEEWGTDNPRDSLVADLRAAAAALPREGYVTVPVALISALNAIVADASVGSAGRAGYYGIRVHGELWRNLKAMLKAGGGE